MSIEKVTFLHFNVKMAAQILQTTKSNTFFIPCQTNYHSSNFFHDSNIVLDFQLKMFTMQTILS